MSVQLEIPPHGGRLINRIAAGAECERWLEVARALPETHRIHLINRRLSDLEMIAVGAFSPVDGFMGRRDYESVVAAKRLANGLPWTIPITLAVHQDEADHLRVGDDLALVDRLENMVAILHLEEKYRYDREKEARMVYGAGARDDKHPGVRNLLKRGDIQLGGKITLLNRPATTATFPEYRLDPAETRRRFAERGWRRIVGFQTRNPIHRAHEYIQKCALETMDGMLLHPLVGETKDDDMPAGVRMQCYEALLRDYYPQDRVLLAVLPAVMRYAGPREAIFHALVRKNYGCTHFIVGRDHAGVGGYYGTFDGQYIFDEFSPEELGITPMFFDNTFFCRACGNMASAKTCPHPSDAHVTLSGTKVRELLSSGQLPPPEITRAEVAEILIAALRGEHRKAA